MEEVYSSQRGVVLYSVGLWPQELSLNGHPLVLFLGQGSLQGPGNLVVESLAASQEVTHGFPDFHRRWELVSDLVIAPDILDDWQDAHSHFHLWYLLEAYLDTGSLHIVLSHDECYLGTVHLIVLLSMVLLQLGLGQGDDGHREVAGVYRDRDNPPSLMEKPLMPVVL
jgi:hypothetical protein